MSTDCYALAAERVASTPELRPYRQTILNEWEHGQACAEGCFDWEELAHYDWAASCELSELLSWVEAVKAHKTDGELLRRFIAKQQAAAAP